MIEKEQAMLRTAVVIEKVSECSNVPGADSNIVSTLINNEINETHDLLEECQ